jgi:hypothetical protein
VYLLITGRQMHMDYAPVAACHPATSSTCRQVAHDFLNMYVHGVLVTCGLLQILPALIGAFVGAPLLAREFESGTFRYVWTQGFGRTRWTVSKLVPLAAAVGIAAGGFSLMFSWYYGPIVGAGGGDASPLYPTIFDLDGVALAAWTLVGFAIGALAGILLSRVVLSMFVTLAAWIVLAFVTAVYLRPHYEAPLLTSNPTAPAGAWVMSQGWFKGDHPASLNMINQTFAHVDIRAVTTNEWEPGPLTPASIDPGRYLIEHGYRQLTTYQPADRFQQFQWIEAGWLFALSLMLLGSSVWCIRRRAL